MKKYIGLGLALILTLLLAQNIDAGRRRGVPLAVTPDGDVTVAVSSQTVVPTTFVDGAKLPDDFCRVTFELKVVGSPPGVTFPAEGGLEAWPENPNPADCFPGYSTTPEGDAIVDIVCISTVLPTPLQMPGVKLFADNDAVPGDYGLGTRNVVGKDCGGTPTNGGIGTVNLTVTP